MFFKISAVIIVSSFCVYSSVLSKALPSYIPICRRTQSDLQNCLLKATRTVRPYISKGIKELNIPAVEPLEIPMIKLEQGTGAVNYKATLTNIRIYGLSDYQFVSFSTDFTKRPMLLGNVDLPTIMLQADYVISGRALVVPIQGSGLFTANITDCKANVLLDGQLVKRKGVEYLQTKDVMVKLQFGGATAHFANLFNGDPLLSTTTNSFINDNAKDIIEEVKPAIEAVASMLVDDIASKILKTQPYDKLFPK